MARQPHFGIGRNDLLAIVNLTSGVSVSGAGITRPIPEPTLGTGQRNPGIPAVTNPTQVSPVAAMNPNLSPSTTPAVPHMGTSAPVTVEAPAKMVTGSSATLISGQPTQLPRGNAGRGKVPGYNPGGPGKTYNTANSEFQHKQNVYRTSLETNTGGSIPTGSTGQSPTQRMAHVSGATGLSASQAIGEHGSIADISAAQKIAPVPMTPDVAAAVSATTSKNLAKPSIPRKKK